MSQQINLFNPLFLKQKKYFSSLTMAQALGLILAGCIAFYVYASIQLGMLKTDLDKSTKRMEEEGARLSRMSEQFALRSPSKQLMQDIQVMEARLKARQELISVLGSNVLGNTSGFSGYMRAFAREHVDGLWLTGFTLSGGGEVSIQGRALRPELVPVYIERLGHEETLQGRSFAAMELHRPAAQPAPADKGSQPLVQPQYIEFNLKANVPEKLQ